MNSTVTFSPLCALPLHVPTIRSAGVVFESDSGATAGADEPVELLEDLLLEDLLLEDLLLEDLLDVVLFELEVMACLPEFASFMM